ncbi:MAG: 50S ribosomal protein L31 [Alphaproteobacteria bacterium]|nr:50S ribosomal protein L31 [Alphaproteobacteria bacterium]MBL0717767.1 50S ribosomal protein L31 [Alphaproteobacteria bacterium]
MKKNLHPETHENQVTFTNGEKIVIFSTVKKDLILARDLFNHTAWTKSRTEVLSGQAGNNFQKRFGDFGSF